jgi:hypothetical protein
MRTMTPLAALVGGLCLSSPAWGDAPLVYCECSQGEWCGPGHYAYPVDSASYPMMEFVVGTNDLDPENYSNVVSPPGWDFAVEEVWMHHSHDNFTFHGLISPGPCWCLTQGRVRWWTEDPALAVEYFTFSFDHPWPGHDVEWELTTRREGPPPEYYVFRVDWEAQVGMGMGPLHGPLAPGQTCWEHGQCPEGHYCFFADCALETGMCIPQPDTCPYLWDPVCGCDGQTYVNACLAAQEGMSLAYHAECLVGDFDLDGDVDIDNLATLLAAYATCEGDPGYIPAADLDGDGCIHLDDLAELLSHYGETCL